MKRIKNQSGFTLVEGLLIILILVVIVGIGYMVYHNDHKTSNANNTSSKTTSSTSSSSKTTTATNSYAGWQQLCSTSGGLCMKYPSSWKLSGSDSTSYTITSPSGTTAVAYMPNGTPDDGAYGYGNAGNCPSNILSVAPITSASGLDIVQAITSCTANVNSNMTSSVPTSSVIPASAVSSQALKAGSVDNSSLNIELVNSSSSSSTRQLLYISDLSNATYTTFSTAQKWFSSSDVQTAGKILNSVSYKN